MYRGTKTAARLCAEKAEPMRQTCGKTQRSLVGALQTVHAMTVVGLGLRAKIASALSYLIVNKALIALRCLSCLSCPIASRQTTACELIVDYGDNASIQHPSIRGALVDVALSNSTGQFARSGGLCYFVCI